MVPTIDELLREDVDAARLRGLSAFDRQAGSAPDRIVLFGAGNLGRKTLNGLRKVGVKPLAFADNNPQSWGKSVLGLPVLSPAQAAAQYGKDAAFVVTVRHANQKHRFGDLHRQLTDLGCTAVVSCCLLFWKYPAAFLPYLCLSSPEGVLQERDAVREAYSCLADEQSRHEFLAQLNWRLHMAFAELGRPEKHPQYFPEDLFQPAAQEVFVDCGAFDGDTIRAMPWNRWNLSRVFALEPDPGNYQKLLETVQALPEARRSVVVTKAVAVGKSNERVRFDASGNAAARIGEGTIEVECVRLDDLLAAEKPTYIKMDIEGSELDALIGGQRVITGHEPVLAICAYHLQNHLWKVPLLIRSLAKNYRIFLRPYNEDGFDLVCYGVPAGRNCQRPAARM